MARTVFDVAQMPRYAAKMDMADARGITAI